MKKVLIAAASAALLTGCAITTEGTLTEPLQEKPDTVCIINNPAVAIVKSTPSFSNRSRPEA